MSAPTRQVPRSRLLPLIAVTVATFVFTLSLIQVRTQWSPLESVDHSLAAALNNPVTDRPTVPGGPNRLARVSPRTEVVAIARHGVGGSWVWVARRRRCETTCARIAAMTVMTDRPGPSRLASAVRAMAATDTPRNPVAAAPDEWVAPVRGRLIADRYQLIEQVGRGGTSVVWRAHDDVLDRPVAVKMLSHIDDEPLRRRLQREAQACGRFNHPRIAQVFDYGETGTAGTAVTPYIVMELVDGEPLSQRLADGAVLDWTVAASIAGQIAEALCAAHARGLAHRDIKPGNVMITRNGVKLVDFGICAAIGSPDADDNGNFLGTPAYVSPERIIDAPVGAAADIYALGLLLYRMLTGAQPWQASTSSELIAAHMWTEPAPLPPIEGLPPELAELCTACMDKQPHHRPSSAEVAQVLAQVAGRTSTLLVSGDGSADAVGATDTLDNVWDGQQAAPRSSRYTHRILDRPGPRADDKTHPPTPVRVCVSHRRYRYGSVDHGVGSRRYTGASNQHHHRRCPMHCGVLRTT